MVGNAGWRFISDSFQRFVPRVDLACETALRLPAFSSKYVLRNRLLIFVIPTREGTIPKSKASSGPLAGN